MGTKNGWMSILNLGFLGPLDCGLCRKKVGMEICGIANKRVKLTPSRAAYPGRCPTRSKVGRWARFVSGWGDSGSGNG